MFFAACTCSFMKGNLFLLLGFLTVKTLIAENLEERYLQLMQEMCELEQDCYVDHFVYCDKAKAITDCALHKNQLKSIKQIEKAWINSILSDENNHEKISRFLPEKSNVEGLEEVQQAALAMFIVQLNEEGKIDENNIPNGYLLMASINTLRENEDKKSQLMLENFLKAMPEKLLKALED